MSFIVVCSLLVFKKNIFFNTFYIKVFVKKSLKITKEHSEFVYWRRTDKTMTKRKVQKDKQRSTKYTYKTKDRETWTSLKTRGELWSWKPQTQHKIQHSFVQGLISILQGKFLPSNNSITNVVSKKKITEIPANQKA